MRLTVGVNVNTGIHVWHEEVLTLGGRGGGSSSVSVRTFIVPLSSSLKKMNNQDTVTLFSIQLKLKKLQKTITKFIIHIYLFILMSPLCTPCGPFSVC